MKKSVILMMALLAGLLCSMTASAQSLEIEEEISQSNQPTRNADYKVIQPQSAQSSSAISSSGYLSRGYRGMVEMAYGVGIEGDNFLYQISTTHGWQFNQYLYLGGFASFGSTETAFYYVESDGPINQIMDFRFGVDFRTYISMRRVSPYVGLKLGYDIGESSFHRTINLSGQLGGRFAIKGRHALNFALQAGLTAMHLESEILFKLGYEF